MAAAGLHDVFSNPTRCALLFLILAAAAILGALGFQHIGGYQPCALCLMQRTPYYIGIPVVLVTLAALAFSAPRPVIFLLFAVLAALALYNAGLGVYHSGVEWELWKGPESCAAVSDPSQGFGSGAGGLNAIDRLNKEVPPSCGEAPWRLFGLSFAGYNVLVSIVLAGLAIAGIIGVRKAA